MPRSISYSRGKGKIRHNNRDFLSSNIDKARVKNNIIITQENLSESYEKIFGKYVDEYNKKQKRTDRKINDYFVKLFGKHDDDVILKNDNKQQSFYEYAVGVGSMLDTGLVDSILKDGTEIKANPEAAKIAAQCLTEYMLGNEEIGVQSFSERNPNLYVFNAIIHMDEKTPHLHYDVIPFADGFKKGMSRQQGISKALEAMGYGKGKDAIKIFTQAERAVFQKICEAHGFEIEPQKKGRGITIPTRLMETYYPIVHENERQIKEQNKQIKTNDAAITEQATKIKDNEAKIKNLNKRIVSEIPPRPIYLSTPKEPERGVSYSYEQSKQRDKEYTAEMKKYKAECKLIEKHNKGVPKAQAEWDNKYLSVIQAEERNREADTKLTEAKKLANHNANLKAELDRREKQINDIISKGIEDGIASDKRAIELAERRTIAMRARTIINKLFKAKYSRIFTKSQYKERNGLNDSKSLEAEPNRNYTTKQKQIERD